MLNAKTGLCHVGGNGEENDLDVAVDLALGVEIIEAHEHLVHDALNRLLRHLHAFGAGASVGGGCSIGCA